MEKNKNEIIFWAVVAIGWLWIVGIAVRCHYAGAQYPTPDYPEGPDDYIESVNLEVERPSAPEGQCQEAIPVSDPVDLRSTCWETTQLIRDNDGQARYVLIRPGCVVVATHHFQKKIDVYQNHDCWILLYDEQKEQKWKEEEDGQAI